MAWLITLRSADGLETHISLPAITGNRITRPLRHTPSAEWVMTSGDSDAWALHGAGSERTYILSDLSWIDHTAVFVELHQPGLFMGEPFSVWAAAMRRCEELVDKRGTTAIVETAQRLQEYRQLQALKERPKP